MRNKNNPQSLVHTNLPSFPRSTFDRGNKVKYSLGIGGYTPVERYDISANSHVKMRLNTKLDSFPSISPLYGTLNLRFDVFFCPYRLYVPELFNNNITEIDEIDNIKFPMLHYINPDGFGTSNVYARYFDEESGIALGLRNPNGAFVPYGSALTYLGYPQMALLQGKFGDDAGGNQNPDSDWISSPFVSAVFNMTESNSYFNRVNPADGQPVSDFIPTPYKTGSPTPWTFNLLPWLAYIDTYCHYIANPFDELIPVKNILYNIEEDYWTNGEEWLSNPYEFINIKDLQKIVPMFRETAGAQNMLDASDFYKVREGVKYMTVTDSLFGQKWWPFGMAVNARSFIDKNASMWLPNVQDTTPASSLLLSWSNQFFDTGILPSTYKPDYFTTWIDSDDYQRAMVTIPNVMSGITVDLLRRRQREWSFNIRQLMSSKRYTDYNYMQYGADLNLKDYPIYVGGDTIRFAFRIFSPRAIMVV